MRRPAAAAAALYSLRRGAASLAAQAESAPAARPAALVGPVRKALARYEAKLIRKGHAVVAGTDEAGRGPLAGPVVAAAFAILDPNDREVLQLLSAVGDSKALNEAKRESIFGELTDPRFEGRVAWSIAEGSVEEIDAYNILQASLAAMARAVHGLAARPSAVLVDGCNRPPQLLAPGECWTRGSKKKTTKKGAEPKAGASPANAIVEAGSAAFVPCCGADAWRPEVVEAVLSGDGKVLSIGAASILAKVYRDSLMRRLHASYPHYGFDEHKGYGTAKHLEAIRRFGPCPQHRRSFAPVRDALGLGRQEDPGAKPRKGTTGLVKQKISKAPPATERPASAPKRRVAKKAEA